MRNLLLCSNGLTNLNEIWNQDILGVDASFDQASWRVSVQI